MIPIREGEKGGGEEEISGGGGQQPGQCGARVGKEKKNQRRDRKRPSGCSFRSLSASGSGSRAEREEEKKEGGERDSTRG